MKKFTVSLILTLALCCCVVGCRPPVPTDPPTVPPSEFYPMRVLIDDVIVQYHRADWYGKEITYAPETVYEMMDPFAFTVRGEKHTVSIDFFDVDAHPDNPQELFFSSIDADGVQNFHQNAISSVNTEETSWEVTLDLSGITADTLLVLRAMINDSSFPYSGELFVAMRVAQ